MNPRRIPLKTYYWPAAIAAAFLLGWFGGSRLNGSRSTPWEAPPVERARFEDNRVSALKKSPGGVDKAGSDSSDGVESVAMDELVRPLSLAELERYLRSGLASRDETYRDLVFAQVLSQFTAEDAPDLIAVFEGAVRKFGDNEDILDRFVARWAKLDGLSAMEYVLAKEINLRSNGSSPVTASVVEGWAESDPGACLAYLDERGLVDTYLLRYVKGAAVGDLEIFEGVLANMEDKKLRRSAIFDVARGLKDKPGALLDWAERALNMENPDPGYVRQLVRLTFSYDESGPALAQWIDRNANSPWLSPGTLDMELDDLYRFAARRWATTDPPAALEWVDRNASDPRMPDRVYDVVMQGWRESDAPGHIAWMTQNLEDKRVNSRHVAGAVSEWAKTDPAAAADWVQRNIGQDKVTDTAAGRLVERWVARAPDEALDWARSLPEDQQQSALSSAARNLPRGRLDEFATWLSSAGGESRFDPARKALAERYVGIDAAFALTLTDTIVDPDDRDYAMRSVALDVLRSDRAVVEAWLPGSGLPEEDQQDILQFLPAPGGDDGGDGAATAGDPFSGGRP